MQKIKERISSAITATLIVVIIGGFIYGGWKLERLWHFKFGYESQVEKMLDPINKKIESLKKRIKNLEGKNKTNENLKVGDKIIVIEMSEVNALIQQGWIVEFSNTHAGLTYWMMEYKGK